MVFGGLTSAIPIKQSWDAKNTNITYILVIPQKYSFVALQCFSNTDMRKSSVDRIFLLLSTTEIKNFCYEDRKKIQYIIFKLICILVFRQNKNLHIRLVPS